MRIVMLVNKFPPVPAGGAERQAERLSEYFASHGVSVGVITRSAPDLPAFEQRAGYWVERVPQPGIGKLKTVTFMISAALSLIRRRTTYDILHAHLAFAPALVAAMVARLLGKGVIVKYGTSGVYGDVQVSQRTLRGRVRLALLRRWTDISVALDQHTEQELIEANFPRERVLRMDNGIEHAPFIGIRNASAKQAIGLESRTVLIYTGRLVSQKNLPMLLEAVQYAALQCDDLHLLVVGQGPDRAQLELLANQLSIASRVTFVGNVQDVRPYLGAADIFVLPSAGEGISNALLEAMASGLACIATTVGGSAEVLDCGTYGRLVTSGSVDELTTAIVELASHQDTTAKLGQAAMHRIQTRYTFSIVGEAYRRLYARLGDRMASSSHDQHPINRGDLP